MNALHNQARNDFPATEDYGYRGYKNACAREVVKVNNIILRDISKMLGGLTSMMQVYHKRIRAWQMELAKAQNETFQDPEWVSAMF